MPIPLEQDHHHSKSQKMTRTSSVSITSCVPRTLTRMIRTPQLSSRRPHTARRWKSPVRNNSDYRWQLQQESLKTYHVITPGLLLSLKRGMSNRQYLQTSTDQNPSLLDHMNRNFPRRLTSLQRIRRNPQCLQTNKKAESPRFCIISSTIPCFR